MRQRDTKTQVSKGRRVQAARRTTPLARAGWVWEDGRYNAGDDGGDG